MACWECLCGSEGRELQCGRGESSAALACRECARGGGGLGWWKGGVGPALGQGQRLLSDRMQGVPTYVAGRVRGACTGACRPARSARSFKKGEGSPRLMHEPDSWSGLMHDRSKLQCFKRSGRMHMMGVGTGSGWPAAWKGVDSTVWLEDGGGACNL